MSQRRQDSRRAQQERRRQERHAARATQRRAGTTIADHPAPVTQPRPSSGFWTTRNKLILFGGIAGIIVIALAWWIISAVRAPLPGQYFPTQGNDHLASIDEPHPPYNSNPPTSGWHLPPLPRPGIYVQPKVAEELGHFMEHGGVWVLYNCPEGCESEVQQLTGIVNGAIDRGRPAALAPYPSMDSRFALVAWQYLLPLDNVERGEIDNFISRHACRYNPEGGPYCSGVRGSVVTSPGNNREMTTPTSTPFSVFGTPSPAPSP
jgi:hypothetical protein